MIELIGSSVYGTASIAYEGSKVTPLPAGTQVGDLGFTVWFFDGSPNSSGEPWMVRQSMFMGGGYYCSFKQLDATDITNGSINFGYSGNLTTTGAILMVWRDVDASQIDNYTERRNSDSVARTVHEAPALTTSDLGVLVWLTQFDPFSQPAVTPPPGFTTQLQANGLHVATKSVRFLPDNNPYAGTTESALNSASAMLVLTGIAPGEVVDGVRPPLRQRQRKVGSPRMKQHIR